MTDQVIKINETIKKYYEQYPISNDLVEAILYSVDAGGKRIRPVIFLTLLSGFGIDLTDDHYKLASALEMIHTGSLIHDDLPAMDDDDYRRGQLTNHKKFDEATAILAGDSLFLDPFSMIAQAREIPATVRLDLIEELSLASGTAGMVAGQMLDIKGEQRLLSLEELQKIHANKTGRLLAYPFWAAAKVAEIDPLLVTEFKQAGEKIGLAFQIRDDILDVTASFEEIGKTPQKDLLQEKSTYPSLLGLEASKTLLNQCLDEVIHFFEKVAEQIEFEHQPILNLVESLRLNG